MLDLDRGSAPDEVAHWREPPSDGQTEISAGAKASADVGRSRSRSQRPGDGARQIGIGRLDVQGVDKSFAGRSVVKGASLYVERGEAVALLGSNRAGKTTLFHMIVGLVAPDRGRIALDGHDITRLPMFRRTQLGIGFLPREASTCRGLDVEQNIQAVLRMVDRERREHDLETILDELGIARLRNTSVDALSGGERRLVEIGRALAARPAYLLLDEPFADVEPAAVDDIQTLVRQLTLRDVGVLIAEQLGQNPRRTIDVADRAYVIASGDVLGTLVP